MWSTLNSFVDALRYLYSLRLSLHGLFSTCKRFSSLLTSPIQSFSARLKFKFFENTQLDGGKC